MTVRGELNRALREWREACAVTDRAIERLMITVVPKTGGRIPAPTGSSGAESNPVRENGLLPALSVGATGVKAHPGIIHGSRS